MSIARSVAVFLLSSIFTLALFATITSYTLGDLLQKDNLKNFIEEGMAPDIMQSQCEDFCMNYKDREQECLKVCTDEMEKNLNMTVGSTIDNVYNTSFYGISINDVIKILEMFWLFAVITVIAAVGVFYFSDEPLVTLSRDLLSISITLFVTALSPNIILSLSNVPMQDIFSDYMSQGLDQQMFFAIVLLAIAIVFIIINYLIKRRRSKPKKKIKKQSKQ